MFSGDPGFPACDGQWHSGPNHPVQPSLPWSWWPILARFRSPSTMVKSSRVSLPAGTAPTFRSALRSNFPSTEPDSSPIPISTPMASSRSDSDTLRAVRHAFETSRLGLLVHAGVCRSISAEYTRCLLCLVWAEWSPIGISGGRRAISFRAETECGRVVFLRNTIVASTSSSATWRLHTGQWRCG
jgi:hypothetical protein